MEGIEDKGGEEGVFTRRDREEERRQDLEIKKIKRLVESWEYLEYQAEFGR